MRFSSAVMNWIRIRVSSPSEHQATGSNCVWKKPFKKSAGDCYNPGLVRLNGQEQVNYDFWERAIVIWEQCVKTQGLERQRPLHGYFSLTRLCVFSPLLDNLNKPLTVILDTISSFFRWWSLKDKIPFGFNTRCSSANISSGLLSP